MRYLGVDFHKDTSYITTLNEEGKKILEVEISNRPEAIQAWARTLRPGDRVAVEAVGHWMYLYEQLEDSPAEFVLSDPGGTKAIASARLKSDKVDSAMLAHLLRSELLPTAYVPPREVRDLREVLRLRAALVHMRTMVKNRIRATLLKTGHPSELKDILGVSGREWCRSVEVRPSYRLALDQGVALGEQLNRQIAEVERELAMRAETTPEAELLLSMPGIGLYSALLLLAEIGEISRFRKSDHLVSWAGMAPRNRRSSNKLWRGPISKRGSKYVRWILIEDAPHAIRGAKRFAQKYESVLPRRGKNKAKTAVAALMLRCIHAMLSQGEKFRDLEESRKDDSLGSMGPSEKPGRPRHGGAPRAHRTARGVVRLPGQKEISAPAHKNQPGS
jgi:transposase